MEIQKNRILSASSVAIGPLLITIGQFIQLRETIYYPIILLLVSIGIFILAYRKTAKFYVKEINNGLLITGSKQGLYDPDHISFNQISKAEIWASMITITLKDSSHIEIYVPKNHREKLLNYILAKISQ